VSTPPRPKFDDPAFTTAQDSSQQLHDFTKRDVEQASIAPRKSSTNAFCKRLVNVHRYISLSATSAANTEWYAIIPLEST
jgi:hypothetical protein